MHYKGSLAETSQVLDGFPQVHRVVHKSTGLISIYQFILNDVLQRAPGLKYLIVFEDDLEVSPDFFQYFKHFAPLLDKVALISSSFIISRTQLCLVFQVGVIQAIRITFKMLVLSTGETYLLDLDG